MINTCLVRLLTVSGSGLYILEERRPLVEREIGNWCFSAHEFSDDELVYGACLMLGHALSMPELEPWRISPGMLFADSISLRSRGLADM